MAASPRRCSTAWARSGACSTIVRRPSAGIGGVGQVAADGAPDPPDLWRVGADRGCRQGPRRCVPRRHGGGGGVDRGPGRRAGERHARGRGQRGQDHRGRRQREGDRLAGDRGGGCRDRRRWQRQDERHRRSACTTPRRRSTAQAGCGWTASPSPRCRRAATIHGVGGAVARGARAHPAGATITGAGSVAALAASGRPRWP